MVITYNVECKNGDFCYSVIQEEGSYCFRIILIKWMNLCADQTGLADSVILPLWWNWHYTFSIILKCLSTPLRASCYVRPFPKRRQLNFTKIPAPPNKSFSIYQKFSTLLNLNVGFKLTSQKSTYRSRSSHRTFNKRTVTEEMLHQTASLIQKSKLTKGNVKS